MTVAFRLAYGESVPVRVKGRFRGPFARWPRAADAALAFALFLAAVFLIEGPGDSMLLRAPGDVPVLVLPIAAAAGAAAYWRRRAPRITLGMAVLAMFLLLPFDSEDGSMLGFTLVVGLYSLGRYDSDERWGRIGIALAIAVITVEALLERTPWGESLFGPVFMVAIWYIGHRLRLREEQTAHRAREQAAEARRIVVEERTRIARELHDVVAHRVSLMTVQAGAAKAVAAHDLEGALQAMGAVEEAGRQALAELRHLLGVLRPQTELEGLDPQPGLTELPRLIEQIRGAGVDVALQTEGPTGELPARVDLFAYRIVQEALTNVLKHAGPGAHTDVRLDTGRSGVVIEVLDNGQGCPPNGGKGGHGIVGMRERALLLGGTLDARPRPGGGFAVVAHLPLGGEPA
jgi:signal transduction histidine kinase